MKFILTERGNEAISLAFVKDFAIERVVYQDNTTGSHVIAELDDDDDVTIKIFESEDADGNFSAAKAYIAKLIEKLNIDGAKFLLSASGNEAINLMFVNTFNIGQVVYNDAEKFCVAAVLSDESQKTISKEFDTATEAEKFLAELVEQLNGGEAL
ncbi:MAG: hypothetical protein IJG33_14315 [Selenomonadaceae bacterium]|nr:hypothetical protein [Selenomonadaceae bacterium]MBQ6757846.1 hypothetical protein [Selenomonadaceae bacterium]MBR0102739.1 hypothetical protein [Selenomonadaceae bacterium]